MVAVDGSLVCVLHYSLQPTEWDSRKAGLRRGNAMTFKPRSAQEQVVLLKDLPSRFLVLGKKHGMVSQMILEYMLPQTILGRISTKSFAEKMTTLQKGERRLSRLQV